MFNLHACSQIIQFYLFFPWCDTIWDKNRDKRRALDRIIKSGKQIWERKKKYDKIFPFYIIRRGRKTKVVLRQRGIINVAVSVGRGFSALTGRRQEAFF